MTPPEGVGGSPEFQAGVLFGRVGAIEDRLDKQDARFNSIEAKLDNIADMLSQGQGRDQARGAIAKVAQWAVTPLMALAAWAAGHFHWIGGTH